MTLKESTKERDLKWSQMMKEAQQGDSRVYETLLHEVSLVMRGFLSRRVRDQSAVEDIIQEILLGIHKARHTYDPNLAFGAWAFAIARYKFTDYVRKKSRMNAREILDDDIERSAGAQEVPEAPVSQAEDDISEALQEALLGLKEKQRRVVELLKLRGHSVKETAKKLEMSESAVKVTAHRAYKSLRKKLEKRQ